MPHNFHAFQRYVELRSVRDRFREGVGMNNWHNEFMAEYQRQRILEQMKQVPFKDVAHASRMYRPGLFSRTMFNFANWMIATGSQLRKRYEVPARSCNHPPTSSLVS